VEEAARRIVVPRAGIRAFKFCWRNSPMAPAMPHTSQRTTDLARQLLPKFFALLPADG
jgi:hypothetical protein